MDIFHCLPQRSTSFKRRMSVQLAIGLCLIAMLLACSHTSSDGTPEHTGRVLVDTKTGEVFQSSQDDSAPATNPKTGKLTLVPGVYCSQCDKWYPQPPPEVLERMPNSRLCPKDRTLLVSTGPIPSDAQELRSPQ